MGGTCAYFFGDDGFDAGFLLGDGRGCFLGVPLATMGRAFSELSESSSLELERTSPSIWKKKSSNVALVGR